MSVDGITKETFEAIRVHARYDEVMENYRRFREYSTRHGRVVSFNFSLMTLNWHEFADFLLFAEQYASPVHVCTVVAPSRYSLFMLSAEELAPIVASLERKEEQLAAQLVVNRKVWIDTIDRLRSRLRNATDGSTDFVPEGFFDSFSERDPEPLDDDHVDRLLRAWTSEPVTSLIADSSDTIQSVAEGNFLGVPAAQCLGRPIDAALSVVRVTLGPMVKILKWETQRTHIDRIISFQTPMLDVTYVRLIIRPVRDSAGRPTAVRIDAGRSHRLSTEPAPQPLGAH
jgi:hypothetical protein